MRDRKICVGRESQGLRLVTEKLAGYYLTCLVHDDANLGTSLDVSFGIIGLTFFRMVRKFENLSILKIINRKDIF